MPSPLAHLAAGYAIYHLARHYEPKPRLLPDAPLPGTLLVAAGFSVLPDIDSVIGLLSGDFGRFHNNASHSLFVGACFALIFASLMWWRRKSFFYWFNLAILTYSLHLVMDMATISRGVMLFWPLTDERYLSPITLFYGLHWSDGWISIRHLWTLLTELVFVALVWGALHFRPWRVAKKG
jgi:membrane-bound metal-dependent hydrolase YbcI (DUF457 family)